jgi:TatA/E family protein of Tat protein translocase
MGREPRCATLTASNPQEAHRSRLEVERQAMPFNIGPGELIIVLIIALIVVGPGRLPDVGSALGKSIREFRKAATDVKDSTSLEPAATAQPGAAPAAVAAPVATPVVTAPPTPVIPGPAVADPAVAAVSADATAAAPEAAAAWPAETTPVEEQPTPSA